ncbi:GNAT family N-acetyltransferase [Pseudarthrobacter sp. YS3]|uniref:GNAT family N-acetyltransferase n=1 Tax=Pseudarthrobacter sp. YS3 TaxID=3453718 RepID=UPI003EED5EAE
MTEVNLMPTGLTVPVVPGVSIRLLRRTDAAGMSLAYSRNRDHLAPWEPSRDAAFFSPGHQLNIIQAKLAQLSVGQEIPWVLVDDGEPAQIVGAVTLTGIVRGPFLSANLGYWVDGGLARRGIGSAAVRFAADQARESLGLHRIQAATLLHNGPSRRILRRTGFQEIGVAPAYLKIAGTWQDHLLHQLILHA